MVIWEPLSEVPTDIAILQDPKMLVAAYLKRIEHFTILCAITHAGSAVAGADFFPSRGLQSEPVGIPQFAAARSLLGIE